MKPIPMRCLKPESLKGSSPAGLVISQPSDVPLEIIQNLREHFNCLKDYSAALVPRALDGHICADDVVRDTVLRVCKQPKDGWRAIPDDGRYCRWLLKVAKCAYIDLLRKHIRAHGVMGLSHDFDGRDPGYGDSGVMGKLIREEVREKRKRLLQQAMEGMSHDERLLVTFRYVLRLTAGEIAELSLHQGEPFNEPWTQRQVYQKCPTLLERLQFQLRRLDSTGDVFSPSAFFVR